MATDFLIIRHAAHVHLNRLLSGRMADVMLSEEGVAQAARLGATLAGERIDGVVASPLDRTLATARAIRDARSEPVPVTVDDALIEIDMGDWTGRPIDGFGDDPAWRAWNGQRSTARIPGGETMAEAQARIVGCLDRLAGDHPGQAIAIVSHSDMIRSLVAHVLGLDLDHLLRFDIDPASVTRIVWGDWGARLTSLNEKVAG